MDRRIRVSTTTRATIRDEPREVLVVGISARTALFVTERDAGLTGSTLTLSLPMVAGEIEVLAGIERIERVPDGFAVSVAFMISDQATRRALNDLMALLLGGDGGGARVHPRVIYDVAVKYGPTLSLTGRLEELSVRGASVRTGQRLTPGASFRMAVPDFGTEARLVLEASVVNQRVSKEGGYHTGVEFVGVTSAISTRLARLLADLLCR